jgi:transcriptional regulator with XRE-family HTH domain
MKMAKKRKKTVAQLVKQLVKASPDEGTRLRAMQIQDRLALPMSVVLKKVPGLTVAAKCSKIGVSRQAYYYWLRGMSRPNVTQSAQLAELTGLNADDIRGRTRLTPGRVMKIKVKRRRKRSRPSAPASLTAISPS